jgi:Mn-dependent DtxR family transcriptional regulator
MPRKYEETIYQMLSDEPVTPNEIAKKLGITHKTALKALLRLALTEGDVKYKNSGRIHLFWKVGV